MLATARAHVHGSLPGRVTAFCEPEAGLIWFYTRADSRDIASGCRRSGSEAVFVCVSRDRELQASILGSLHTTLDLLHRDKFWSSSVAAWYPKGKNDPSLTMLCLDCRDTMVWISEAGRREVRLGDCSRQSHRDRAPPVGGRSDSSTSADPSPDVANEGFRIPYRRTRPSRSIRGPRRFSAAMGAWPLELAARGRTGHRPCAGSARRAWKWSTRASRPWSPPGLSSSIRSWGRRARPIRTLPTPTCAPASPIRDWGRANC